MKTLFLRAAAFLLISITTLLLLGMGKKPAELPEAPVPKTAAEKMIPAGSRIAVLAGGCFWGIEGVFERLKGVADVTSGYAGGDKATAKYELVGTGKTGHAESVEIIYDPARISYRTLLEVFFTVAHDPTQLDYQGPDKGTQYRSAVFYTDTEQKEIAETYIKMLENSGRFSEPIVTRVVPLDKFYPAEDYHQDFMDRNPDYPYIVYWDLPKIRHLLQAFPELVVKR